VWTYIANWLVQDGEVPELYAGARLNRTALRASCWSIREARQAQGVQELSGNDPDGERTVHYEVTGTVEWGSEPSRVLLRVGEFHVLAEPNTFREVGDEGGLEPYSPTFWVPAVGAQVALTCKLVVLASYESDSELLGFEEPDIRRDWLVKGVKVEHRPMVPISGRHAPYGPGAIGRVDDVDRMHRWADEAEHELVTYLVDLHVLT